MDSSNLYLENLHFIKALKVKTIKWVDIESLHDFIEIWNSNRCAWLNFEQFSGHITCIKCTSLHWHCKWIEWKSSLTFVDWCVWTGICIYRVYILCLLIWPWGPVRSHCDWLFIDPEIICNPGWAFNLYLCVKLTLTLSPLSSSQKHDVRSNFVNWIENLDAWLWEYLLIISTTLLC